MSGPDEPGATGAVCPACGEHTAGGDLYCESCGQPLDTVPEADAPAPTVDTGAGDPLAGARPGPCRACGGTIDADGYCGTCGAPAGVERDHWVEQPADWVAAVCDRGIRHAKNEDALAVAADDRPGGVAVLVVCDGVTSAPNSDVASLAAARAARDALCAPVGGRAVVGGADRTTAPDVGGPAPAGASANGADPADDPAASVRGDDGAPSARVLAWGEALRRATAAAHEAAAATADAVVRTSATGSGPPVNPPSCTFVAAAVDGPLIVTGCVGDSRAYWLADDGPFVQLTTDDSWAAEQMAEGMARRQAESGPHAHAITRWLGLDSPDPTPALTSITAESPGWLLVCSDGLWNYCSEAAELAALVGDVEKVTGREPVALATGLVEWANRQGGHDNISVALARLSPGTAGGPIAPPAHPT